MNKPFSVTARAWKDVPLEKGIFIHSLTDLLNNHLKLSDYGDGVVEFNFTAIIEPEEFFPTKYRYLKSKKRIDAEIRMDYDQAVNAAIGEFKGLVAQLYLSTLDLLEAKKITDFDLKKYISAFCKFYQGINIPIISLPESFQVSGPVIPPSQGFTSPGK